MSQKVYEAIGSWARIPTWHTSHPLDMKRFHEAIKNVAETVGTQISEADFEEALRRRARECPPILGGSASEEKIKYYTEKAITILNYLDDVG